MPTLVGEAIPMKAFTSLGAAVLFLCLGATVPAFTQEEHHEQEAKPEKQAQQAKPEKQQQQGNGQQKQEKEQQQQQAKGQQKQEKEQQQQQAKGQQKPEKEQQQQQAKGQQKQEKEQQQQQAMGQQKQEGQHQASSSEGPQRTKQAEARQRAEPSLRLSASGSGRIPDDRFRSNFGREHRFRIGSPRMVDGYSRFQYGGYWFGFVQPWPVGWYYTDQVYVNYIDGGYFLYNPYYPGVRVAISVVL